MTIITKTLSVNYPRAFCISLSPLHTMDKDIKGPGTKAISRWFEPLEPCKKKEYAPSLGSRLKDRQNFENYSDALRYIKREFTINYFYCPNSVRLYSLTNLANNLINYARSYSQGFLDCSFFAQSLFDALKEKYPDTFGQHFHYFRRGLTYITEETYDQIKFLALTFYYFQDLPSSYAHFSISERRIGKIVSTSNKDKGLICGQEHLFVGEPFIPLYQNLISLPSMYNVKNGIGSISHPGYLEAFYKKFKNQIPILSRNMYEAIQKHLNIACGINDQNLLDFIRYFLFLNKKFNAISLNAEWREIHKRYKILPGHQHHI